MAEDAGIPWYRQRRHFFTGFVLHCLSGILAVAVHYGIMYCGLALGLNGLTSTSIGFSGGAVCRFMLAYFHIFTPSGKIPVTAARFTLVIGVQFIANGALFGLLLGFGLAVWPAQLATTAALTGANYLVYRYWVFR